MFCKECGALMMSRGGKLACPRCSAERNIKKNEKVTIREAARESIERLVVEGTPETLPKTNEAECEKCGAREAYYHIRQTRAADEAETRIYRCVKCGHTWREY